MVIYTAREFCNILRELATEYKTIYMYAAYGFKVTTATIEAKAKQNLNGWYNTTRINALKAVANKHPTYWGFDCVNMIKGILWGWDGDESKTYGGAQYGSKGVPDTNANGFISRCNNVSTNFDNLQPGEAVWLDGHIGVHIGEGLCVECTPRWSNSVQITRIENVPNQHPEIKHSRRWVKRGKIPEISYTDYTMESETLGDGVLKLGMCGASVEALQNILIKCGYDVGPDGADGEFGINTQNAVKKFQQDHNIYPNGVCDSDTLTAILAIDDSENIDEPTDATKTITITGTTVNVRNGNGTQYTKLSIVSKGQKFPLIARAENGWVAIPINGCVGWVSGIYAKEGVNDGGIEQG